jgi:acetolactate decarboxylase
MAAKIPNDIYQFSLISALKEGLTLAGPPVKALGNYGTDGIGTFSRMDGELLFLDSIAYHVKPNVNLNTNADDNAENGVSLNCVVERAKGDQMLPFVMVTKFVPEFGLIVNGALEMRSLRDVFGSEGPKAGGQNDFLPFRVRGEFESVSIYSTGPSGRRASSSSSLPSSSPGSAMSETAQHELKDVKGTVFGFVCPKWAEGISVSGMYCHFLSEKDEEGRLHGGHVKDFKARGELDIAWSVTGRFHLGLPPPGEEWDALRLKRDTEEDGERW